MTRHIIASKRDHRETNILVSMSYVFYILQALNITNFILRYDIALDFTKRLNK